ncbi:uncharacterized protein N7483_000055 [Penicillium malachiteum]|uniref:uncharacterized protein n=1 Tax=Penicillium malachiteum TaxID=1324776 RepID=UPI002547FD8E|nr:uncharacterized protein N7483_000055 [Penicillium malachiteum]KAJ5734930.1 hypothetical protein N7483_000055 [Penicillium malachiteum]
MPSSSITSSPDSARTRGSGPRPQARSAGMAERPSRNESLSDLVRFFQTQNMPLPAASSESPKIGSPDSTTALPTVVSPEPKEPMNDLAIIPLKEQSKPLHRRLLQFTQRQKKESSLPRSKSDENKKQIEALQREGYLLSSAKPKSGLDRPKNSMDRSKTSFDWPKNSLERKFSKSKKQDVEAIGRPWLSRSDSNRSSNDPKRRLASLDLDDFGSMLDVAVSLSEFDDTSPPPYQPSTPNALVSRGSPIPSSLSTSALSMPRPSSEACSRDNDRSMSSSASVAGTQASGLKDDELSRPSSSIKSSTRIVDQDSQASSRPSSIPSISATTTTEQSLGSEPDTAQTAQQPKAPSHSPPNPPGNTPSPPSLKLFPDVAPPRISSKNAWRLSGTPRYQTTTKTAPPAKSDVSAESPKPRASLEMRRPQTETASLASTKNEEEPTCSGAMGIAISTDSPSTEVKRPQTVPEPVQGQRKSRPPSLAMGTLKAFPLPAPTRPLPSIPKPNTLAPPVDSRIPSTVRAIRSASKICDIQNSQPSPIAEEPPRDPDTRPATVLGQTSIGRSSDDDDEKSSPQTTLERPKSASPEQCTPRRRSSSIGVSRIQEFPESPDRSDDQVANGQPLADSPVLGKLPEKPHGKRATRKGLHINPRADRKHLPFGLPSPPPTASLPAEPTLQQSTERMVHRNYTAPISSSANHSKNMDMSYGPHSHRASMISRSNSSRSSLRHESIPESSFEHSSAKAESPLASSDDEAFGPSGGKQRPLLIDENQTQKPRAQTVRRGYETADGRSRPGRLRYPGPIRPSTPQGRKNNGADKSLSPQSAYSQSTMRSRDSHSSHRVPTSSQTANQILEDRIAKLEHQNQVLQAALMAALNAGIKPNIDLHESAAPLNFNAAGASNSYQGRFAPRPDSWMSSSRGSELSGFDTPGSVRDARANTRQLENMFEDGEAGWLSDKSSIGGVHSMSRHR